MESAEITGCDDNQDADVWRLDCDSNEKKEVAFVGRKIRMAIDEARGSGYNRWRVETTKCFIKAREPAGNDSDHVPIMQV
jgi:hypothetical protein